MEANEHAAIHMAGIFKHFGDGPDRQDVLVDVDFSLAAGDTLSIVGASGIGKSTLLHIMGTLESPDSGSLMVAGTDPFSLSADRLSRFRNREIGFVFQFHHLLPGFTALENTAMPALIHGIPRKEARRRAEELLGRVGLSAKKNARIREMSGGEQQRTAIARALVMTPAVLLADEPTGNLDLHNGDAVHQLLTELNREMNMTLVVVTHDMRLARRMRRMVTLIDGRLHETDGAGLGEK